MKVYWNSLTKEQQGKSAEKVGSAPDYLRLVLDGYKKASFVLARKLEQCISGATTEFDLEPGIYPKGQQNTFSSQPQNDEANRG